LPAVTPSLPSLRRLAYALFLGLTVLCVLAKPIIGSAHEVHELAHALADAGGDDTDRDPDDGQASPLHAEDQCCFHAIALPMVAVVAALAVTPHDPPTFVASPPPPSPATRFLRPPIAA
jgi:hypothetical protein